MSLSSRGFSLLETLISIALIGFLLIISITTLSYIFKTKNRIETEKNLTQFTFELIRILNDPDQCDKNFQSLNLPYEISEINSYKRYLNAPLSNTPVKLLIRKDQAAPFDSKYTTSSLSLKKINNKLSELIITFELKGKSTKIAHLQRKFKIYTNIRDNNTIQGCCGKLEEQKENMLRTTCAELRSMDVSAPDLLESDGRCVP